MACRTPQRTAIDTLLILVHVLFPHPYPRLLCLKRRVKYGLGKDKEGIMSPMSKERSAVGGAQGLRRWIRPVGSSRD